jgi:hypothetical protein
MWCAMVDCMAHAMSYHSTTVQQYQQFLNVLLYVVHKVEVSWETSESNHSAIFIIVNSAVDFGEYFFLGLD